MITVIFGCLIGNFIFLFILALSGYFIFKKNYDKIKTLQAMLTNKLVEVNDIITSIKESLVNVYSIEEKVNDAISEMGKINEVVKSIKDKLDKLPFNEKKSSIK